MLKKLKERLRNFFNGGFVHPVLDSNVNTVIDSRIKAVHKEQDLLTAKYNEILNSYLRTYFGKQYTSQLDMAVAFKATNKEWKSLARKVNATEKLINLSKDAFEKQVALVVSKMKENQTK